MIKENGSDVKILKVDAEPRASDLRSLTVLNIAFAIV